MSPPAAMPRRLAALIIPVCIAGLGVLVAAAYDFATSGHTVRDLAGIAALTAAATLAERFPVPISPEGGGVLSLTFVFAVAAIVLYGWAAGALLLLAATAIVQLAQHRPLERIAYNVAVLSLVALAAGALIAPIHGDAVGALVAKVVIAATADNVVNVVLISAAMALSTGNRYVPLMRSNVRATAVPFAFMASAALMLVVLWERSPVLSTALVGPLLAISLYQRSTHRALRAMRLALTDPLTGLGNHRHFHERLQRELQTAEETARPLTLCFVDIDDFKRINDRFGHPSGDRVLAKAVDARDTYTGSHSGRVAELAARLALRLGLDPEQVELTRLAGSLHDLGKLAIPEELLRKAGELTDSERLVLERHPQIGYRMLDSLGVDPVADVVLHHHERWDGAGYPDGLRGEEIPLGARIIFVADAYDAMTSDRVYRARRSHEEALGELRRCTGTQFDPLIVDAFAEELEPLFDEEPVALAASEDGAAAAGTGDLA